MEIWKDIEGFEGYYQVSNTGKVKSLKRYVDNDFCLDGKHVVEERILKPALVQGYPTVGLAKNGKCHMRRIHRLVAQAFIPNPENKATVNHIDGDHANANVSNLEWATQRENNIHAHRTGLISKEGTKRAVAAMNAARRRPVRSDEGLEFPSVRAAANYYGIPEGQVNVHLRKPTSICHGHVFKYMEV